MGTPYHHYLVADPNIIPEHHEIFFSEKILRLPCYQPNDRKRTVAQRRPSRAEVGLPENAFVFCSLNGMQKITPRTFHRWMMILSAVPDSVLWLLEGTADTNDRLRKAAAGHGVAPSALYLRRSWPIPITSRAIHSPTCSSIICPMVRTLRRRIRSGCRSRF